MRFWLLTILTLLSVPAFAQTAHERRLDTLVQAAKEILIAEAQATAPRPRESALWCVKPDAPNVRVRVAPSAVHGQWLWCFPVDLPPWWAGPWR